jgi:hypothetical protein
MKPYNKMTKREKDIYHDPENLKRRCRTCGGFIPLTEGGKFGNYCKCTKVI